MVHVNNGVCNTSVVVGLKRTTGSSACAEKPTADKERHLQKLHTHIRVSHPHCRIHANLHKLQSSEHAGKKMKPLGLTSYRDHACCRDSVCSGELGGRPLNSLGCDVFTYYVLESMQHERGSCMTAISMSQSLCNDTVCSHWLCLLKWRITVLK